jgi:uncharacterized protein (DUF58 family)
MAFRKAMSWLVSWLPGGRVKPEPTPATLHRRRVYILPTGYGLVFGALMLVMLVGSLNFNNAMGLLLTFLLAVAANFSSLYCYRNLVGLIVGAASLEDTFAGAPAVLTLRLDNTAPRPRPDLAIQLNKSESPAGLRGQDRRDFHLQIPTQHRGKLKAPRCAIATRYPLGLFRSWSWVHPNVSAVVYPSAEPNAPEWPSTAARHSGMDSYAQQSGDEDFDHIRDYRYGDSPGHIAWKIAARRGQWVSKSMNAPLHQQVILRWDDLSPLSTEARLCRLTAWVVRAHQQQLRFGLELPKRLFSPDSGERHYRECLRALGLFGLEEPSSAGSSS